MKCVVCEDIVPKERGKKDTCSPMCGIKKMAAWSTYLNHHKTEIMIMALEEYKREH